MCDVGYKNRISFREQGGMAQITIFGDRTDRRFAQMTLAAAKEFAEDMLSRINFRMGLPLYTFGQPPNCVYGGPLP